MKGNIIHLFIFLIFTVLLISSCTTEQGAKIADIAPTKTQTATKPTSQENLKEFTVVSKSFDDFGKIYCDIDATNLQKLDLFEKKFKNNYVEWTGEVSSISESLGRYSLQVKHCKSTWTSDIIVTMKDNQKDKLLTFREGDIVTYRAKLTRLGDILGLSAIDGEVIKIEEKREEESNIVTGNIVKEIEPETKKTEEFKFNPNSIVNTQNGISLALDDFKYELKTDWGKLTEITIKVLNKGNTAFQPKVLVFLYDEKDRKEEWFQTKAEIEFDDIWKLEVGDHITKKAIVNIPFNDLDLPKKLELALLDAYEFGNKPIVVVEKEFKAE